MARETASIVEKEEEEEEEEEEENWSRSVRCHGVAPERASTRADNPDNERPVTWIVETRATVSKIRRRGGEKAELRKRYATAYRFPSRRRRLGISPSPGVKETTFAPRQKKSNATSCAQGVHVEMTWRGGR